MEHLHKVYVKDDSVVITRKCQYEGLLEKNGFKLITKFHRYGEIVPIDGYGMNSNQYFKIRDRFAIMQRIADGVEKDFIKVIKDKRSKASKKAHKNRGKLVVIAEDMVINHKEAQVLKCLKCGKRYKIRVRRKWLNESDKWNLRRYFYANCCRKAYKLSNTEDPRGFLPQDVHYIERAKDLKFKVVTEK